MAGMRQCRLKTSENRKQTWRIEDRESIMMNRESRMVKAKIMKKTNRNKTHNVQQGRQFVRHRRLVAELMVFALLFMLAPKVESSAMTPSETGMFGFSYAAKVLLQAIGDFIKPFRLESAGVMSAINLPGTEPVGVGPESENTHGEEDWVVAEQENELEADEGFSILTEDESVIIPDDPGGAADMSELFEETENFDVAAWLGDFDPDADFGIFDKAEPGPGVVNIRALNEKGEHIDGVAILENGFKTGLYTDNQTAWTATELPYGERLFEVEAPFCYDLTGIDMVCYETATAADAEQSTGQDNLSPVGVADEDKAVLIDVPGLVPLPIQISDKTARWEITFHFQQRNEIRVSYYYVSPNNRFYELWTKTPTPDTPNTSGTPDTLNLPTPDTSNTPKLPVGSKNEYIVNTFDGSQVRLAVFIEMPSTRDVKTLRIHGEGFGEGLNGTPDPWQYESFAGDFSMPNWTFTAKSWQLLSHTTPVTGSSNTGPRFFILNLPLAEDGLRIRLEKIELTLRDGGIVTFSNSDPSDVTVQLVPLPKAQ